MLSFDHYPYWNLAAVSLSWMDAVLTTCCLLSCCLSNGLDFLPQYIESELTFVRQAPSKKAGKKAAPAKKAATGGAKSKVAKVRSS